MADQAVFSSVAVPGNLALALSVEFPTAVSRAHTGNYDSASNFLGYFDPNKCYRYNYSADETLRYFFPAGAAASRQCSGDDNDLWSGNFLNWATMQTIDPFRWALTGGYRSRDEVGLTLIEKAWHSGQGGTGNFPNKNLSTSALVKGATPLIWSSLNVRVQGLGNKIWITSTSNNLGSATSGTAYNPANFNAANRPDGSTIYEMSVRVKVCDPSGGTGGVESNCTQYPNNDYKPTGLMQQYSDQIRFSAFGYLNDSTLSRDGGVLRANQKFVGPSQPVPGGGRSTNANAEWDANTGAMVINPNPADVTATATDFGVTVSNSGVMNYLNKFGSINKGNYKSYDPVSELFYAAVRYYKNQGNVPEWTTMSGATPATKIAWADGFPVITKWEDPILYSCQKNFILGIGDANTHADRNLPGATGGSEPAKPSLVAADKTVDATVATNRVGTIQGISSLAATSPYGGCCNNNGALMAGLAYDSNTKDIRPDDPNDLKTKGRQSIQTYWLDVLESGYETNNQFFLATKFGGFTVPDGFDPYAQASDLPLSWWHTNTDTNSGQPRPDNYFTADKPDKMVDGLSKAFASIVSKLKAYTTSFSTAAPQITSSGTASFAAQYDSNGWTGDVIASTITIGENSAAPSQAESWRFSNTLTNQAAGTGWDTGRRIVSFNTSTKTGVPFRLTSLASDQQSALDTTYRSGSDAADYLSYLRGDRKNEVASSVTGSAKSYRDRTSLVGDIVGSKAKAVGKPTAPYSSNANPGYDKFLSDYQSRQTMVYVGANDGMLHAINGSTGAEVFAYVPGSVYQGPDGTPAVNGLQALGNPNFAHYNFVDATPAVADVDFGGVNGWRSLLVGGLGKGGRTLYAIDVTDPTQMTSESAVASKVLWEISANANLPLGYTYGEPAVMKTRKYGWVIIVGSGYNNADGKGYFIIIKPSTGEVLKTISTGEGSTDNQAGLAHVRPFYPDLSDGTADAVYAGDLLGNLWRLDLSSATNDPTVAKIATLTGSDNKPLPVTSRPLAAVHPKTLRRYITVGTGRLLHGNDSSITQAQRFYAILDGSGTKFSAAPTTPYRSTDLLALNDLTQPISLNLATQFGWYIDLGRITGGAGWRVIADASAFYGTVMFSAMVPSANSVCEPGGSGRVYAVDLGDGTTQLDNNVSYLEMGLVTEQRVIVDPTGKPALLVGSADGSLKKPAFKQAGGQKFQRLNWREVPVTE
ncbi:hypothetical protein AT984_14900 [Paucibacter sp. KCTC 42545]|nr:hypothetical protein AT984_14900 [Paucibacter sp. KCTC 42545]